MLPAQITVEVPTPEALEASVAAEPKDLIRMGDREGELGSFNRPVRVSACEGVW